MNKKKVVASSFICFAANSFIVTNFMVSFCFRRCDQTKMFCLQVFVLFTVLVILASSADDESNHTPHEPAEAKDRKIEASPAPQKFRKGRYFSYYPRHRYGPKIYRQPVKPYINHFYSTKPRYRPYRDQWRNKWQDERPYMEDEVEPYDDYDELDDRLAKPYYRYDDPMPLSSRYIESRNPMRYHDDMRPTRYIDKYEMDENRWKSPHRLKFRRRHPDPKYEFYDDLSRPKYYSREEEYDFSNEMQTARIKPDTQVVYGKRKEAEYDSEKTDIKNKEAHDVVYSAKYRGNDKPEDKSDWHQRHKANDLLDDAVVQKVPTEKLSSRKLIAYMSANPLERIVGKQERYIESPYKLQSPVYRQMLPIIDQDIEITFDERINDWKT